MINLTRITGIMPRRGRLLSREAYGTGYLCAGHAVAPERQLLMVGTEERMAGSGPDLGLRPVTQYGSSSVVGSGGWRGRDAGEIVRLGERRPCSGGRDGLGGWAHAIRL